MIDPQTASAEVDLDAFRANVGRIARLVGPAAVMVVVKADGYGHGMTACGRAARDAGAEWLGVATPEEALALRRDGDSGRLLAWLYGPDTDLTPLVAADVDVTVHSEEQLSRLVMAAGTTERRARVHLKLDSGLSRNGAPSDAWPQLCAAAAEAEEVGAVDVVSIWSHLAAADELGTTSPGRQRDVFERGSAIAEQAGIRGRLRHLANSAGALVLPAARYDLVRVGIAAYGIDPAPGIAAAAGIALQPVLRLRAQLVNVKSIAAGVGVSYGHTWRATEPTRVGLVPLGYGDGIPRHAGNTAWVGVGGRRVPVRGRICMDQFVVDLGANSTDKIGDEVTVFGDGAAGEPTAADWAGWCGTIGYEIVTRIGSRVPRIYGGSPARTADLDAAEEEH